jgi:Family of unknown function (DUF5677)
MAKSIRVCKRSEVEHLRKFLAYAKRQLNEAQIYPPLNSYRCLVALALYSKCVTVAEAILVLLEAGFADEAFGMTRTIVDISFTMHYLANKDSEERAKLFYQFHAKNLKDITTVVQAYWPQLLSPKAAVWRTSVNLANYPRPHSWSGKPISAMALEPHTAETDLRTGKPFVNDLGYRLIFQWTSHYVHPTIICLRNHMVRPGHDPFVVRSDLGQDMTHLTAFFVTSHLASATIAFYRCLDDPQPVRLSKWLAALLTHIGVRHQDKKRINYDAL